PFEMFGGTRFPPAGDRPYLLTLSPHSFYWFELRPARAARELSSAVPEAELPRLRVALGWEALFREGAPAGLEAALPRFLNGRRFVAATRRRVRTAEVQEAIPLLSGPETLHLALVRAEHDEGDPEIYMLPLGFATGERAGRLRTERPQDVIARLSADRE